MDRPGQSAESSEPLAPLAAIQADAEALDRLARGEGGAATDPALQLLAALRAHIEVQTAPVDAEAIARDARMLDVIAAGRQPVDGDEALRLLAALRARVDQTMPAGVPTQLEPLTPPRPALEGITAAVSDLTARAKTAAVAAPGDQPTRLGRRRRTGTRVAAVAVGITAVLGTSGVAAATYTAHPGGTWYGLRAETFGRTDDDPVVAEQAVETGLASLTQAQTAPVPEAAAFDYVSAQHALETAQRVAARVADPVARRSVQASIQRVRQRLAEHAAAPVNGREVAAGPLLSTRPSVAEVGPVPGPSASGPGTGAPASASPGPDRAGAPSGTASPTDRPGPSGSPSAAGSASPEPSGSPQSTGSPEPSRSATATPNGPPVAAASSPEAAAQPTASAQPGLSAAPRASSQARPTTSSSLKPTAAATATTHTRVTRKTRRKRPATATLMTANVPADTGAVRQR